MCVREGGRLQRPLPTSKCLRVLCQVSMFTHENWCWGTHTHTHTDFLYMHMCRHPLSPPLAAEYTHTEHSHRPERTGLIGGPSELGEAFNQGQHTALGITLTLQSLSLSLLPPLFLSFFHSLSPHTEQSCWLSISRQHFVPEKLKLDHWRVQNSYTLTGLLTFTATFWKGCTSLASSPNAGLPDSFVVFELADFLICDITVV